MHSFFFFFAWLFLSIQWPHRSNAPASVPCICRLWAQAIRIGTSSESLVIVLGAEGADMNKAENASAIISSWSRSWERGGKEGYRQWTG